MCVVFFLTGDNSYLSTVQIIDSLGPRRVQVDRGGSAGCAGLPEIYRDSSIPRGERGKYAIRVGRTVSGMYLPMLSLYLSVCIYLCCHYTNLVCIYLSFYYTFLVFIYLSYHCHHLRLHSVYPCPLPSSSPGRHRGRLHHPNLTYRLCREPYPAINKWQIMLVSNKIHNSMFTVAVSLVRRSNHFFKTCLKKLS